MLGVEHPWAGEYTTVGTDTSDRLLLAPESGYIVHFRDWRGRSSISEVGSVRFEAGQIAFAPDPSFDPARPRFRAIPLQWGERKYLLRPDNVTNFCNRVNSGSEALAPSRSMWIQCRDGAVSGKPELPAPYEHFIRDEPLEASVLEKQRTGIKPLVLLDVGRAQGVFEQMQFLRLPYDGSLLKVEEVLETTCKASCPGGSWFVELPIGAKFSTLRQIP